MRLLRDINQKNENLQTEAGQNDVFYKEEVANVGRD